MKDYNRIIHFNRYTLTKEYGKMLDVIDQYLQRLPVNVFDHVRGLSSKVQYPIQNRFFVHHITVVNLTEFVPVKRQCR